MEKVNILYSIIIPHYNVPELLQRCLNSIPNLPSFQIIIVDDCSDGKIVDFRCFPGMERVWGIERSGFFNGREKWAKGFENQRV